MNNIYVVDPETKHLTGVEPVSFGKLGIKERKDLEQWVIQNPRALGEELFIVTSEFDRFESSSRRLDILALDTNGALVVVELKLELSHSYADQQAIRYAAFCSTMTMADVIAARARFTNSDPDKAEEEVREFLGKDELPELDDRPRVILAAGSLDDQELTATVLWLRSFGVDITCVELTPYQLPDTGTLLIAPRIIIPLPEAREYVVRVQQKEAVVAERTKAKTRYERLWTAILDQSETLSLRFTPGSPNRTTFLQVRIGRGDIHYEWMKYRGALGIGLHFEAPAQALNQKRLALIEERRDEITTDESAEFVTRPFGKRWACAEFRLPYEFPTPPSEIAPEAARLMKTLIDRTWPIVEAMER